MKVKGDDRKIALAYFLDRFPIGSELWDPCRSGPIYLTKSTVIEVHSDMDEVLVFNPKDEYYTFIVHKPGKHEANFQVHGLTKRWIFDYYNERIVKKKTI